MKTRNKLQGMLFLFGFLAMLFTWNMETQAKGNADTIKTGVFAGWSEEDKVLDLSGMTAVEAENALNEYIEQLKETTLTFVVGGDNEIQVTPGELGLTWTNPQLVSEAISLGTKGNVIQRYKAIKDLEQNGTVLVMELAVEEELIAQFLEEKGTKYDKPAVNVSLQRENGEFSVVEGQTGYALNLEVSQEIILSYLTEEWNHQGDTLALSVEVTQPRGSAEELAVVQDVIGTYSTSFASSNSNRQGNVRRGAELMNGITLYPGEEFSAIEVAGPFNEKNGYFKAGAFVSGKVVESYGGGICQVSTTLYNALLRAEVEITKRNNHSMIVSYVEPAEDAAIATSSGKDLKFVNNMDFPIYIEAYTTSDKKLIFNIYGVETRDSSRTVEFISEILEENVPTVENIYPDSSKPVGYVDVQSAHIGYKAKLWKVVKENGEEVSRELVNNSTYAMSPRSATVGVATSDANAYNEIMAAIGTGSINHVKLVASNLVAAAQIVEGQAPEQ